MTVSKLEKRAESNAVTASNFNVANIVGHLSSKTNNCSYKLEKGNKTKLLVSEIICEATVLLVCECAQHLF